MIGKLEMNEFHRDFNWLVSHPIFNDRFLSNLDIEVVKVNPKTKAIDDNDILNTEVRVWLECGPVELKDNMDAIYTHDIRLDCDGESFEKAICELAKLVRANYGDY